MSVSPGPIATTKPVDETVATGGDVDCHTDWVVTVCVVPLVKVATAVNCAESPGFAADVGPVTVTAVTVVEGPVDVEVDVEDPPPQAAVRTSAHVVKPAANHRYMGPPERSHPALPSERSQGDRAVLQSIG
jgi:hypothetical protein